MLRRIGGCLLLLLYACTASPAPPTATVAKPLPPASVTITLDDPLPVVDAQSAQQITLRIDYTLDRAATLATTRLTVSGPALHTLDLSDERHNLAAGDSFSVEHAVDLRGYGPATLSAALSVYDADGDLQYAIADQIDLLLTGEGSFSGRSGTLDLQTQHLRAMRDQGLLSEADYQAQLEQLLGGGATESITIEPPAP